MRKLTALGRRLSADRGGLAMLEFAFGVPILLTLVLSGTELMNYIITRQRVSQLALHLADNAARLGTGTQLQAKTISEADIEDLLTGTGLQSGDLELYAKGRVVVTSVEPMASPNTNNTYKVGWQRCRGSKPYTPRYNDRGLVNIPTGYGPAGRMVAAIDYGVTMFVEVHYEYQPIIKTSISPSTTMTEIASMMVRDRRDTSDDSNKGAASVHPKGVYKVAGVTPSTC